MAVINHCFLQTLVDPKGMYVIFETPKLLDSDKILNLIYKLRREFSYKEW